MPFTLKLQYVSGENLDKLMHEQYGYVTMERESWEGYAPTREVLAKLRSFLEDPVTDDDGRFIVTKWIRLVANYLGVPWAEIGVDNGPMLKRSRLHQNAEGVQYVDDSFVG